MDLIAVVAAVAAVLLMVGVAAFAVPRLRAPSQEEDKRRALTVLFTGLSGAAVLTVAAVGSRFLAG